MGAANSKIEEEKALLLCRERKKFVRQALDGRCSLAAAHVAYIQSLKLTGTALRKFLAPEAPIESSLYTSTTATPEPVALTEKSLSQFSFSSPTLSQPVEATENLSPSPSPPSSTRFQVNHMRFRGFSSNKVEEKHPLPVTGTVTSSSTPQNVTPYSSNKPETSPFEGSSGTPPWDFFGFFHPIDHQFSFQDGKGMNQGFENLDRTRQLREEEGIPELEDEEEKASSHEREESQDSEDEFDESPTDTLVRSFENLNRIHDHRVPSAAPTMPSAASVASESELLNGEKSNSPHISPPRTPSSAVTNPTTKETPVKEDGAANKVAPKDFLSSMKDIEYLFMKASESGKEVSRMLDANKLHFRPIVPGKESGSVSSTIFKACFSCGEEPSQVQEAPPQAAVKYLTWHRTTSSRSSSSRNLLGLNANDDSEDLAGNLFDNFCMISGSHASTLDRLYAWERKLYDDVKACEMIRRVYDSKCRILRQLESKGESSNKIDKTRAVVKDLHSRIRVAIYRIDSISKRIEELRDKELQPQLEELIKGLSRMWDVMLECHKLQFQIFSVAYNNGNYKISLQSESHRHIASNLVNELSCLSSTFAKWIGSQKSYLQSINNWLLKCVCIPQKSSRRKRRPQAPNLKNLGPPIYVTCGDWMEKLDDFSTEDVVESMKCLAADTTHFLPHQEKNQGKLYNGSESADNLLRDEASEDWISGLNRFQSSLKLFLGQLNNFAGFSAKLYTELQISIEDAKTNYERWKLRVEAHELERKNMDTEKTRGIA
ncbi:hypothetical protein HS088_TW02G00670 [Tripterygium wilfordii]|uniref:Uncharacterized protein n=1 Tax=Tripterygium wilfordii TaxID=458696 RepID=A0A7J7DZN4_TRIWF|nr:protein ALTERED PHOSPHATE STARVATION RESPONSE 1-like [Tripterygium wilfordii]XP_038680730.1 protein ALTERED PHOSPHATE STARVATION RESPONSE 1-like [Tripterygium wilfordii]XP_038680738.1 protein ALTERED PHOSPHATE STARVATION RESPONSE 1-like [Tripterygium wilfordii]XP_038680748.1 protein ALTERED PHOSPHATE STARVATION RESPONSE 1-like [Tripterygium wilfordii]XP_038680758.1 protein ALTERED PHOSPHATE STARVATION RESPONSE 1-like [Tripterygium wilfordii]XP_038680764.1 protein ALTERED PHOSPHATE STARVATIO